MVRRCCVTNCNDNYNPQNRVKTFRLPRSIEERKRWIVIIPRDVPDTNNTVVCERHTTVLLVSGTFRPKNFLYEKLKTNEFNFAIINYLCNDILYIQSPDFLKESAIPRFLLCINKDLTFEAFDCGVKISVMTLSSNRVYFMNKFSHIQEVLRFVK